MGGMDRTVKLRVGLLLTVAIAAALSFVQSIACSNKGTSDIVGEWQLADDGGTSQSVFFNSDGTCGFIDSFGNQTYCDSNCHYSYNGDTLTVISDTDGGYSDTQTVNVSVSGSSLTISPTDGGGYSVTYSRTNSNSSNSCP